MTRSAPRTTVLLLWLATALLAPGARGDSPGPPPPGIGIRLLEAPVARENDPRSRTYVVDQVKPGTTFTRRVEISNGDPVPAHVLIYAAPATIQDGGFAVGAAGGGAVPQWVSVSPSTAELAPGGRAVVLVTVRVPADAAPGEVYGAVVVERPGGPTSAGLAVSLRAAVRIYLSVGPGNEPASDFTIESVQAGRSKDGVPRVLAQVRNTGGRALDMRGTLRLSNGPGGLSGGPFAATLGTTLGIGQSEPVTVVLSKAIGGGPWLATLDLRSGLLERKASATITFPEGAGATAAPVMAKALPLYRDSRVVTPVAAVLIGLLALALLVVGYLTSRRRGGLKPAR